jgi:hypothetical protein
VSLPKNIPQCQHIKINGVQCGSPAMRGKELCYFHDRMRQQFPAGKREGKFEWSFPVLEDANSVQCALMQTLDAIAAGNLDHSRATLLLRGLRTASVNLKKVNFKPGLFDICVT